VVSESWVSQHLRLLKLPEAIQTYIAQGSPVEGERFLRGIAEAKKRRDLTDRYRAAPPLQRREPGPEV
jgi:hypothetical protein